jgi:2-polyprenyl-6-methoxyphenol hydroxylase-like FAD-dependent oxidoreductase
LREVGAGIALWPNATRALGRLGVLDRVAAISGTLTRVRIAAPGGRTLFRVDPSRHATPALCIERPALVPALRSALPESTVHFGRSVASVEDTGTGIRARFSDGGEAGADLLVGADGLRSVVRAAVLGETPPVFCGQTVARGIGPLLSPLAPGDAVEVWGDGLRVGIFDVGGGRAYWYLVETRAEAAAGPVTPAEHAAWLDALADWHAPLRDTLAATRPECIARHAVFDRPPQRPWSRGRTVLVATRHTR